MASQPNIGLKSGVELLSVGEAFDDLIFAGLRRLPRLGEELRVPTLTHSIGGGAIITAVGAARLGLRVSALSAVNEGAARILHHEGVELFDLRQSAERAAVSVSLSTRADRAFVTFDGVNRVLEPRVLSSLRALRHSPRHAHFALSPLRCKAWLPVLEQLRATGCTTSWDFGWNDRLRRDSGFEALLGAVDWMFVNEQEAKFYTRTRSLASAERRWRKLARNTVIKLGPEGAIVLVADGALRSRPPHARAVDTTGAGDAFNAGFIAALLRGGGVADALRLANYVGARSTEGHGGIASLPTAGRLPQWARRRLEAA